MLELAVGVQQPAHDDRESGILQWVAPKTGVRVLAGDKHAGLRTYLSVSRRSRPFCCVSPCGMPSNARAPAGPIVLRSSASVLSDVDCQTPAASLSLLVYGGGGMKKQSRTKKMELGAFIPIRVTKIRVDQLNCSDRRLLLKQIAGNTKSKKNNNHKEKK